MTTLTPLKIFDNAAFDDLQWAPPPSASSKENLDPAAAAVGTTTTIDEEIEAIESQISLLSKRLDFLKIKKADASRTKRGRIVPAKFLADAGPPPAKKVQESPVIQRRRGLSVGPAEISRMAFLIPKSVQESPASARRRGLSVGPDEILRRVQDSPASRTEILRSVQDSPASNRRRGLSVGPDEILRRVQDSPASRRGGGLSVGPVKQSVRKLEGIREEHPPRTSTKPKAKPKVSDFRNGIATVGGAKKPSLPKAVELPVKPKALFQEPAKRPSPKVRIVASRYNEDSKKRKWSLPGPASATKVGPAAKTKRSASLGGTGTRSSSGSGEVSPMAKLATALPRIKTVRMDISPRDSGCAKRVADLIGKKSCFAAEVRDVSCQSLDFDDED